MGALTFQTTDVSIVCSTVCSSADQTKHQSPASLAFVMGIHWWPVNSPHKGPVRRKMIPFVFPIHITAVHTVNGLRVAKRIPWLSEESSITSGRHFVRGSPSYFRSVCVSICRSLGSSSDFFHPKSDNILWPCVISGVVMCSVISVNHSDDRQVTWPDGWLLLILSHIVIVFLDGRGLVYTLGVLLAPPLFLPPSRSK